MDTAAWWDELRRGNLTIPTCACCAREYFPPQANCPWCGGDESTLSAVAGPLLVYSWIVIHRSFAAEFEAEVPYAVVAVETAGGARLVGRLEGDHEILSNGLKVWPVVVPQGGYASLWFRPAPE
jgi:uncharacterized OB-fold protein